MFQTVDWGRLLLPSMPLAEIVLRASVTYLVIFVLMRLTPQRQASGLSLQDLIVVVLIADAASPALAGQEASSLSDGLLLVIVVMFWNFAINWLTVRWDWLDRFAHPRAIPLIRHGVVNRRAMRQQMVTEEELKTVLRRDGLERWDQVKRASLEGDGNITIVPDDNNSKAPGGGDQKPAAT